jgi:hypothetical protein
MMRFSRPQPSPAAALKRQPEPVANMAAMSERLGLSTVPAAWPSGVSQLAIAIDACQRCEDDEVCGDWRARG